MKTSSTIYTQKTTRSLKIAEKVSINIASKASYVYISSGQELVKNAKYTKIEKLKWDIFGYFQTLCECNISRYASWTMDLVIYSVVYSVKAKFQN